TKCIDLTGGNTANGGNIQLWTCSQGNTNQEWYFYNDQIKLFKNSAKALDLKASNTSNGTNIQLYDDNGSGAQKWIYDGVHKSIRLKKNLNKCLDVYKSYTSNGTNIQLWDCHEASNQQWVMDNRNHPLPATAGNTLTLHSGMLQERCIDLTGGKTSNGNNIQLWTCSEGNTSQAWVFEGDQIRLAKDKTKCVDLYTGN